ncbi:hypothetical protein [Algoriphagus marinus]|uniref:hypothetical protein n=1 Tax=Algoriphagus marinus TaxID=1925762 RepID=UPI00094BBD73|nr:hypothetical protein [Algoriphagus marinus]
MNCPICKSALQTENLNIATDTGLCTECKHIFKVSELLNPVIDPKFDIKNGPKGTWLRAEINELIVGGSTRSVMAFFLVPFMIIWTSLSVGGTLFAAFSDGAVNWFLVLFSIPFLAGAVLFWSIALMFIWGKVEVQLHKTGGTIFTGLGKIGRRKHFTWQEVDRVGITPTLKTSKGYSGGGLFLEGPNRRIDFGSFLNAEKKIYFQQALTFSLQKIKNDNRLF